MDISLLKEIMSKFSSSQILVIGDLMIDEYLWGNVDRISPEAPIQVVDVKRENRTLGGAGNVIANLVSLGCKVDAAGVIGDDQEAEWIISEMNNMKVGHEFIINDQNRPTTKKTRVIAINQQVVRIDRETRRPIASEKGEALFSCIKKGIKRWQAIILSDYGKGILTLPLLKNIISLCREKGIMVIVDPKGRDLSRYKGATIMTPNKKEALLGMGLENEEAPDIKEIGQRMLKELDLQGLVITLGAEGMSIFLPGKPPKLIPARAREVYDVSGAGDTVVASITLSLASGAELVQAGEIANLAAGIVVGKIGTATVTQQEILAYSDSKYAITNKIINNHEELSRLLAIHKQKGKKIIFTNGCFDLIHLGHIRLLHEAKSFGEILVVGLNTDESVRRLKGPARPCLEEEERAHIIASLDCVDYVTLFSEDTPLNLIKKIKPDILVKGSDYSKKKVIGWDIVEAYGGEVRIVELIKDLSTSRLIQKIIDQNKN